MNQTNGQSRGSTDSDKRAPRDKQVDPQQQASAIEKSVTNLLVATKQLLETLTAWSKGATSESEVSDVYVRLGYEFNIACRAFGGVGIDTTDLGPVPDTLRAILEETLSQEACQASLDKFLPRIRDIIINLLHGLKRKQQKLRQKTGRDAGTIDSRHASIASHHSQLDDGPDARYPRGDSPVMRSGSNEIHQAQSLPPRTSSASMGPVRQGSDPNARRPGSSAKHDPQLERARLDASMTPTTMQEIPSIPPTPQKTYATPAPPPFETPRPPRPPPQDLLRPQPRQQDALAALQRGGELERRASRRFSAYQIQKHLGTPTAGVPIMPPTQRSPVPNRGRDIRESMNAVRTRGSQRSHSNLRSDTSPNRNSPSVASIREEMREPHPTSSKPHLLPPSELRPQEDSPHAETPEENHKAPISRPDARDSVTSATINQPWNDQYSPVAAIAAEEAAGLDRDQDKTTLEPTTYVAPAKSQQEDQQEDQQSKEIEPLTLFLQYRSKVKKFVLPGGYSDLSLARLQLAFIDKFAWNTHSNGAELPDIYVQDQVSGVRHELEDLNDVRNNSVLVLNVDDLDEMRRHFDDGFGGLRNLMDNVKLAIDDQQSTIQRVSERQQEAAKELTRFAAAPAPQPVSRAPTPLPNGASQSKEPSSELAEVQTLRRELAVMRQTYSNHLSSMESAMSGLRNKAVAVKSTAIQASIPSVEGGQGRAYVDAGKKQLNEDSERILNQVDDLQDTVEDLRKDVVSRGVRPLPRQLESVNRDIAAATAELRKLREYMKREKPVWKRVAEDLLTSVTDDQNQIKMQDELAADLEDDLEKLAETFSLVEQATKQQNLSTGPNASSRSASRTLNHVGGDVDPLKAKDVVLGEVKALQPNHENRLEAIERAEKARQLELANRGFTGNAFKRELGNFVDENKLKKTGGIEETERLRIVKDERARKENFERMAARAAGLEMPEFSTGVEGATEISQLDVPSLDDGGTISPEPEFVEAAESPLVINGQT